MSINANDLQGMPPGLRLRCEIAEKLAVVNQIAYLSNDADLLKWLRNRLGEPYVVIQKRLKERESADFATG